MHTDVRPAPQPDTTAALRTGLPTRLAGAGAALVVTLSLMSMLGSTLDPARLSEPPQIVQWERITIVGERPATTDAMAQAEAATRSN